MRIVLDTAILIRATAKATGPARLLLERIAAGQHQLILSPFLLEETERVLSYPRIQALYGLSPTEIEEHIDLLTAAAEIVDPVPGEPVVREDRTTIRSCTPRWRAGRTYCARLIATSTILESLSSCARTTSRSWATWSCFGCCEAGDTQGRPAPSRTCPTL